jgi:hypothetical protein
LLVVEVVKLFLPLVQVLLLLVLVFLPLVELRLVKLRLVNLPLVLLLLVLLLPLLVFLLLVEALVVLPLLEVVQTIDGEPIFRKIRDLPVHKRPPTGRRARATKLTSKPFLV